MPLKSSRNSFNTKRSHFIAFVTLIKWWIFLALLVAAQIRLEKALPAGSAFPQNAKEPAKDWSVLNVTFEFPITNIILSFNSDILFSGIYTVIFMVSMVRPIYSMIVVGATVVFLLSEGQSSRHTLDKLSSKTWQSFVPAEPAKKKSSK